MTASPIPRLLPALVCVLALPLVGACGDDAHGPLDTDDDGPATEFLSTLIVSNPVTSAEPIGAAALSSGSAISDGTVYSSLPPGSFPDGERATIRARSGAAETTALMVAGGFDPVPIEAAAGGSRSVWGEAHGPLLSRQLGEDARGSHGTLQVLLHGERGLPNHRLQRPAHGPGRERHHRLSEAALIDRVSGRDPRAEALRGRSPVQP